MRNKRHEKHIMLQIIEKRFEVTNKENLFATLFFDYDLSCQPGQFVMLWIPGIDEKPFAISYYSKHEFGITIEVKGPFSFKAANLKKGDLVGIRGPFGNFFNYKKYSYNAVVAGGCGLASLATLVEKLPLNTCFIHGARSKNLLLYLDRFDIKRQFCTDDGSFGYKGFVTDVFENSIKLGQKFEMVYACGPEVMMYNVFNICQKNKIPCQISLERYMRCGFGICGACVCNDQIVCKDGPVFNSDKLCNMDNFNKSALLRSGRELEMKQYFSQSYLWKKENCKQQD